MTDIRQIKYAGSYTGPSYGGWNAAPSEGFTSIESARKRYTDRQQTSGAYALDVTELTVEHGRITAATDETSCWPATTTQDVLEVYRVHDGEIAAEPFTRFTATADGRIHREDY